MSGPNENDNEMIRFGESPGPEVTSFGEGAPVGEEVFGPPVAQGFVPPDSPADVSAPRKAKKGKKNKKKTKGGGRKKSAGGGKKSPKVLILVAIAAVVFLTAVVTALLILKPWAAVADRTEEPEESEPAETIEPSAEPAPTPTPTPPPTPTPAPAQEVTKGEAVEYIESLSPSVLGLEGESMEEYEVYPGERVVLVEDIPCTEIDVYTTDTAAGTNDIQGRYLLTKTGPRRLFRLDTFTKQVTELPLSGGS